MDSFTLDDDLEATEPRSAGFMRYFLVVAAIFVGLFIFRSLGVVNVDYATLHITDSRRRENRWAQIEAGRAGQGVKTESSTYSGDFSEFGPGVGFSAEADLKVRLADIVAAKIAASPVLRDRSLKISVRAFDVSGSTWVPLSKNGSGSYRLTIESDLRDTYSSEIEGNFEFTASGFCTSRTLVRKISETIGADIAKALENDFKK